jgi:hypothetical protein
MKTALRYRGIPLAPRHLLIVLASGVCIFCAGRLLSAFGN